MAQLQAPSIGGSWEFYLFATACWDRSWQTTSPQASAGCGGEVTASCPEATAAAALSSLVLGLMVVGTSVLRHKVLVPGD